MVCPLALGGAIDPSPFVAGDGRAFLLWKNDGNCCRVPTRIWSQPLTDDGLGLAGPPVPLVAADQAWEAGVVEAPAMLEHDGRTYLFYSGNAWDSAAYAIGYALCDGPAGPCRKPADRPWLGSSPEAQGPGSAEFFVNRRGSRRMVFHAWIRGVGYHAGAFRNLFATGVTFRDGVPVTAE
jgi:GH43 family beta-xylosidase